MGRHAIKPAIHGKLLGNRLVHENTIKEFTWKKSNNKLTGVKDSGMINLSFIL